MHILIATFIGLLASAFNPPSQDALWLTRMAEIRFTSDAPLELIEAASVDVTGVIRTGDRSFAFTVLNESFKGFNSPLQQEHFYENYMETDRYVRSSFSGKIIDEIDFTKVGTYRVRGKGVLDIHGVTQNRIIEVDVIISANEIKLKSEFEVLLEDHSIRIPKIVHQKIAEEIRVEFLAELERKQ